jgi:hypothetical protein
MRNASLRPRILGYRRNGAPIWSIAGASPDDPSNDPAPSSDPTPDPTPIDLPVDAGKTFTQADVDRIIQGRLSKYADYDQIKQQVAELQPLQEQFSAIAKVFGVGNDDSPPDPAKLTEQLTAEQARAREAAVQLAVYRNAGANGANPDALLDSASFLRSVAEVDPNDTAAVATAIKVAVEANPVLKAADDTPTPGQAGIGVTGGGRGSSDPRTADLAQIEADLAAAKRR